MNAAVESASHYFKFESELLSAEDAFNRATLSEFNGRFVSVEIDIALEFYQESVGHLDLSLKRVKKMLRLVRKEACISEFNDALEIRLAELGVNDFPRISSGRSKIRSLEDALVVQKSEFKALRRYAVKAIEAVGTIADATARGLFVATLLGEPNELKTAKGELEYGKRTVTALLAATTRATALALEDIFPLGSELLLDPKSDVRTVEICHVTFSESDQSSTSRKLSVEATDVRRHLAHGDTLGSCR